MLGFLHEKKQLAVVSPPLSSPTHSAPYDTAYSMTTTATAAAVAGRRPAPYPDSSHNYVDRPRSPPPTVSHTKYRHNPFPWFIKRQTLRLLIDPIVSICLLCFFISHVWSPIFDPCSWPGYTAYIYLYTFIPYLRPGGIGPTRVSPHTCCRRRPPPLNRPHPTATHKQWSKMASCC